MEVIRNEGISNFVSIIHRLTAFIFLYFVINTLHNVQTDSCIMRLSDMSLQVGSIKSISVAKLFWNFAQSTEKSLSCYVQIFETIRWLKKALDRIYYAKFGFEIGFEVNPFIRPYTHLVIRILYNFMAWNTIWLLDMLSLQMWSHNTYFICPITLKFCRELGKYTAVPSPMCKLSKQLGIWEISYGKNEFKIFELNLISEGYNVLHQPTVLTWSSISCTLYGGIGAVFGCWTRRYMYGCSMFFTPMVSKSVGKIMRIRCTDISSSFGIA